MNRNWWCSVYCEPCITLEIYQVVTHWWIYWHSTIGYSRCCCHSNSSLASITTWWTLTISLFKSFWWRNLDRMSTRYTRNARLFTFFVAVYCMSFRGTVSFGDVLWLLCGIDSGQWWGCFLAWTVWYFKAIYNSFSYRIKLRWKRKTLYQYIVVFSRVGIVFSRDAVSCSVVLALCSVILVSCSVCCLQ